MRRVIETLVAAAYVVLAVASLAMFALALVKELL